MGMQMISSLCLGRNLVILELGLLDEILEFRRTAAPVHAGIDVHEVGHVEGLH